MKILKSLLAAISLVPRPHLFLHFVCVHNNTWEWKTDEKWGGTYPIPKRCTGSNTVLASRHLCGWNYSFWRNSLSTLVRIYIFKYQPLPPFVTLESTHMMNTPRPSSTFTGLPLPCIISLEGYNREGLGTRINHSHIHPFQLNATTFVDLMSCTRLYQTQGTGNNASSFVVRFNPGLDYRRLVQATNLHFGMSVGGGL